MIIGIDPLPHIAETVLMGPGPSTVPPEVYEALAVPCIGHLDPRFITVMDETKAMLQKLMQTSNRLTMPMSGTGSAGMETCFVNLVEKGNNVLVLQNGVFGVRMAEVAGRLGADVDVKEFPWGTPVTVEEAEKAIRGKDYNIVAVVHAETSTGVANPVAEIGRIVADTDALYLVDSVTSLGGMDVRVDDWSIDAVYSGTQKCLSCPPGLSPVSFSDAALAKLEGRKTKVPNWYLDLSLITAYWEGSKRSYHHTAPISMIYALHRALRLILTEGMENVHRRHREAHQRLAAGLADLGLDLLVEEGARLPMLNAVRVPDGVDEAAVRSALLNDYHIEIGAGLGPLAGKIWRIGVMGHTARPQFVDQFLEALKEVLS